MFSRSSSRRSIIMLCVLLTVAACRSSPDKNSPVSETPGTCDTAPPGKYQKLRAGQDPLQLSKSIRSFYHQTDKGCRHTIALDIISDMFDIVYQNHYTDTVVLPFLEELSLAEELTETQQGKALLGVASFYLYGKVQPDSAEAYLRLVAKRWPDMNDTVSKSYHSVMGQYMLSKAKLKEAGDHYLKTIALCEKLKDSAGLAGNYANYGTVFSKMGEYYKSIAMKQKAVAFFKGQGRYDRLLIGYVGIGVEYGYLRRYDSSRAYYLKAIELTEKGIRNPNAEFDLYISIAAISLGEEQYDTARYYYNKIKEIIDLSQDERRQRVFVMASTPAYAVIRNVDTEIAQIRSYIPGLYAENNLNNARDAYYTLFHIYYLQKKFDKALPNYMVYDSLKSVLAREENKQYVAEMETKYETQKKELKIEVQQKELRQGNILNGFLLALLATLGLTAAFIITRIQLARKRKEAELQQHFTGQLINNTEEERKRIAKDLHDGISQELLILKRQIGINQANTHDRIDAIINEVRLISRDLHPVMLDQIGLALSVEHICNQVMEHNHLFITTEIQYSNSLSRSSELQLFRMIQEGLNNIVKYAGAEAAKVTISESATFVYTEIKDNGKGFDVASALNSKASFGLLSLIERSKSLKGKAHILSSEAGTLVKIEIPKSNA